MAKRQRNTKTRKPAGQQWLEEHAAERRAYLAQRDAVDQSNYRRYGDVRGPKFTPNPATGENIPAERFFPI